MPKRFSQFSRFLTVFLKKVSGSGSNQLARRSSSSSKCHSPTCLLPSPSLPAPGGLCLWPLAEDVLLKRPRSGSCSVGSLTEPLSPFVVPSPTCKGNYSKAVTGDAVSWIDLEVLGDLKDASRNVRFVSSKFCAHELNSPRQFGDGVEPPSSLLMENDSLFP